MPMVPPLASDLWPNGHWSSLQLPAVRSSDRVNISAPWPAWLVLCSLHRKVLRAALSPLWGGWWCVERVVPVIQSSGGRQDWKSKNRAKSVSPLGGPWQFSEQATNMFHLKNTLILESIYLKQTRSPECFLYLGLKLQKCLTKLIPVLQFLAIKP